MSWYPLAGSDLPAPDNATRVGPLDPDTVLQVTVIVRSHAGAPSLDSPPSEYRTHDEARTAFAAAPEDIALVQGYLGDAGLRVAADDPSAASRSVVLSGRAGDLAQAFDVGLDEYVRENEQGSIRFHVQVGALQLPDRLVDDRGPVVQQVFGLDTRPVDLSVPSGLHPGEVTTPIPDLISHYAFPAKKPGTNVDLDGTGQVVGIVRIGGAFDQADLDAHYGRVGINPLPAPPVVVGQPLEAGAAAHVETPLDIEIVGTVVPRAKIVVYYAAGLDNYSLVAAVVAALWDSVNQPSVISISWGAAEKTWSVATQNYLDMEVRMAASSFGVTVCAASGDYGSGGIGTLAGADDKAHAVFPASCPHVLACGGTTLRNANTPNAAERVWNTVEHASGGGISDTFPLPAWQRGMRLPRSRNPTANAGRGVPDVAAHAGEYDVVIDGQEVGIGGTSASTPLWAGLIARVNQARGKRLGFFHPYLYAQYRAGPGENAFGKITSGNNKCPVVIGTNAQTTTPPWYYARRRWNACTGLGSPKGNDLLSVLMNAP